MTFSNKPNIDSIVDAQIKYIEENLTSKYFFE